MMRKLGRTIAISFVLTLGFASGLSWAASADDRYERALSAMLADLGNSEASFEFAKVATAVGDVRGAIAALERILLVNPTLANIQLELGVLYARTGSLDLALPYLESALRAPDMPLAVRERAEEYLARASSSQRRHSLSGQISAGIRHDSNGNAAPDGDIFLDGRPVPLSSDSTGASDASLVATAELSHLYSLNTQRGSTVETDLLLYSTRYDDLEELDLNLADLTFGPRFFGGSILEPSYSIRPFFSTAYWTLNGDDYLQTVGCGFDLRKFFETGTVLGLRFHYRDREFTDYEVDGVIRRVEDRSGDNYEATASLSRRHGRWQLTGLLRYEHNSADEDWESYDRISLGFYPQVFFAFSDAGRPWSFSFGAGLRETRYDAADLIVTTTKREDTRWDASARLTAPIGQRITVSLLGIYTDNDSEVALFDYDNTGATLSIEWRF